MQPAVGFLGEVGAEAEGLGEGELGAVEAGHDVLGAAPVVDGLGGVADHDELGVVAVAEEDVFDDGVGVLGLVQQQEVGVDPGLGEGPHFQVVVVVEAERTTHGALESALATVESCPVVLTLLNKTRDVGSGSHYGYYHYGT